MPVNWSFNRSWLRAFLLSCGWWVKSRSRVEIHENHMKIEMLFMLPKNRSIYHPLSIVTFATGVQGVPLFAALPKFWVSKVSRKFCPCPGSQNGGILGNIPTWTTNVSLDHQLLWELAIVGGIEGHNVEAWRSCDRPGHTGTLQSLVMENKTNCTWSSKQYTIQLKFHFLQRKFGTA